MEFSDELTRAEFKKKAVLEAIAEKGCIDSIAQKYSIAQETLQQWIDAFYKTDAIGGEGKNVAAENQNEVLPDLFDNDELMYSKMVLDNTPNIINIIDITNYEILYMNKACIKAYSISNNNYRNQKCYKHFYNADDPCAFCTLPALRQAGKYQWQFHDPINNKDYQVTDRLFQKNDKNIRMEIGVIIEENADQVKALDSKRYMDETLFSCIRTLTKTKDMQLAIDKILEIVCTCHQGTRGYIFELSADGAQLNNTYEWCAPGFSPEMENLQNISMEKAAHWFVEFSEKGSFSIFHPDQEGNSPSLDFRFLQDQHRPSVMAAPLIEDGLMKGFIGVDNPKHEIGNFSLLTSVTYFIMNDIQKRYMISGLKRKAYRDALTQLNNRNKYIQDIERMQQQEPSSLGVVYADLNGLKRINKRFGQAYGDLLLKQVADLLRSVFDARCIYRVGVDEFVMLCVNCTQGDFNNHVSCLREALSKTKELTLAYGVAWEEKCLDIQELINYADKLMYANKQGYYEETQVEEYNHSSTMAKRLISDLENGRYVVYLQPKISLSDGTLYGAEALVRGIDQDGTLIPPDRFIPNYESRGIIRYIDFFVLGTICRLISDLQSQGKEIGSIAVNFSRVTLLESDIVSKMLEICESYHVDPSYIIIEVTESTAELKMAELMELVQSIKAAGFGTSLDDYGAKYSNIEVLSNIGFDEIKLDQSIISKLSVSEKKCTITQHTIHMLKALQVCRVVAEGIETAAVRDILKQQGCDCGQGYLFSGPIPIHKFLEKYVVG